MPFAWSSRDRLTAMRMVPLDHGYFKFEMIRWKRRSVKNWCRLDYMRKENRVDNDRENRRRFPGRIGLWPVFKYGRRASIRRKIWRLRYAVALNAKGRYRPRNA